jgi:hypothetical protein
MGGQLSKYLIFTCRRCKMSDDGSKYVEIKMEIETGKLVEVKGGRKGPIDMTCEELQELYDSQDVKLEHIGTILHTHSSPG